MFDNVKKYAKSKIYNLVTGGHFPLIHSMEAVYQRLVERELVKLNINDTFYPVAGAASYSLFYLLIRSAQELPIASVLELGAGESSKLLDALAKQGILDATITTLEHDARWAELVSAAVSHPIVTTSLTSLSGYDLAPVKNLQGINLLLIDGPPASSESTAFARVGAVDLIDVLDNDNFLIIIDDAHRIGEMLLADKIETALTDRSMKFRKGQIITSKRQIVFGGGALERAAYY